MEQKILEDCYRLRRPLPQAIREAPELNLGLEFAYQAFWELTTCRPVGFGVGAIPWSAIREYALAYGVDEEEDFSEFTLLIRAMDRVYVDHFTPDEPSKKS